MHILIKLDDENIAYYPNETEYSIIAYIDGERQIFCVKRENFHKTYSFEDKLLNPILKKLAIECIREHIAQLHIQGI